MPVLEMLTVLIPRPAINVVSHGALEPPGAAPAVGVAPLCPSARSLTTPCPRPVAPEHPADL